MTALFCRNSSDRSAASWHQELARFEELEFVVSDAAKGIAGAVTGLAGERRKGADAPPLAQGLDLFHTAREARTVLRGAWRKAEKLWVEAERCDGEVVRARREGIDSRGRAQTAAKVWRQATAALERVERQEAAWRGARAALELFDEAGRVNTAVRARRKITAVLGDLDGVAWRRVRNFLVDRRSWAFLERLEARLAAAEPRAEWRAAMVWRWWGRHRGRGPEPTLVERRGWFGPLSEAEATSYEAVAEVLRTTVRASSAVECLNSVLRMQQGRHRRMTQGMLDLKGLFWNCQRAEAGRRKGTCPYQGLGLKLPTYDFWKLLQSNPEELMEELSAPKVSP